MGLKCPLCETMLADRMSLVNHMVCAHPPDDIAFALLRANEEIETLNFHLKTYSFGGGNNLCDVSASTRTS